MPKVILVDTEPHILMLLKSRFEQEGFEVVSLGSAQASSQQIAENRPDLIVLGRHTGEHDRPVTSFEDLLKRSDVPPIPIILLATSDAELGGGESVPQRDVASLKMPFRPSQLVELARKAVTSA